MFTYNGAVLHCMYYVENWNVCFKRRKKVQLEMLETTMACMHIYPELGTYLSSCSLKNNPAEKMMENYIAHPSVSVSVWSKEVT